MPGVQAPSDFTMPAIDLDAIRAFVQEHVPEGLRGHCERTATRARMLAIHHGVDPRKAEAAGLLHDFVKYYSREELDAAIREIGFGTLEFAGMSDHIVHGPAGALLVEQRLDINDKEILEAIRLHSTADAEMGDVAKVVFLADFTEDQRAIPVTEEDRDICLEDLDGAVLHVLSRKIAYVLEQRQPVDTRAWQAYNALATRVATRTDSR